jgi:HlyD family secretion protein
MQPIFTVLSGGQNLDVKKFTKDGIYLSNPVGEVGQDLAVTFCVNANGIALEIPTIGEIKRDQTGDYLAARFTQSQSLALRTLFGVDDAQPTDVVRILAQPVGPELAQPKQRKGFQMAAASLVSLFLIGFIGLTLNQRYSVIVAPSALISSDGLSLESNVSGKLEYIAKNPIIQTGEIFAAVRTLSGRSVYLESGKDGNLVSSGLAVGHQIAKGAQVFQMENPDDKYFVKAYVNYADAVRISNGYRAEISFDDPAQSAIVFPNLVSKANITPYKQFKDEAGSPLVQVRLDLGERQKAFTLGKAVKVKFVREKMSFFGLSLPFAAQMKTSGYIDFGQGFFK